MREACSLVWLALVGLFRSRASLEAEILILRHQLNIQRRQSPKRLNFSTLDRLIFAGLYRLAPSVLGALAILKPETVIRWHRAGFRSYWRWKSRPRGGVAEYMARRRGPPSQGWKTFLRNHADGIAAMDLFVVPTISFRLLYGLLTWGMVDGRFYGVALPRIRPQNGSQTRSRKRAAGSRPLAI
jgi:hypothetical protein